MSNSLYAFRGRHCVERDWASAFANQGPSHEGLAIDRETNDAVKLSPGREAGLFGLAAVNLRIVLNVQPMHADQTDWTYLCGPTYLLGRQVVASAR